MEETKKKIRVKIGDIECTLATENDEEYVKSISKEVEKAIFDLMGSSGRISYVMAASIAAMTFCDEYKKEADRNALLATRVEEHSNDEKYLKDQVEELKSRVRQLNHEKEEAARREAEYKRDIEELNTKVSVLTQTINARGVSTSSVQAVSFPTNNNMSTQSFYQNAVPLSATAAFDSPDIGLGIKEDSGTVFKSTKSSPITRTPLADEIQKGEFSQKEEEFDPDKATNPNFSSFFEK